MILGVAGRFLIPILVAAAFLSIFLASIIWFIMVRYKFMVMAQNLEDLKKNIEDSLKEIWQKLKENSLEEFSLEWDMEDNSCEKLANWNEKLNKYCQTENIQLPLEEEKLSKAIEEYNQEVVKFKSQIVVFPVSLVVGTKYQSITLFDIPRENQE